MKLKTNAEIRTTVEARAFFKHALEIIAEIKNSGKTQKENNRRSQVTAEVRMSKLTVAGIGPGEADYILPAVIEKMKKSHTVIAAKRILPVLEELCQETGNSESVLQHDSISKKLDLDSGEINSRIVGEVSSENSKPSFLAMGKIKDTLEQIGETLSEGHDVVMAVSGDPLMYSLYRTICNDPISGNWDIDLIPGVGSLQMLGAAFGETMEDAFIISVHGRAKTAGSIALAVTEHPKVFFLCSKEQGPAWLSQIMLDYQLDDVTVCAGANLSYGDEILASGTPAEMVKKEFPSLCVAMIKNPFSRQIIRPCFLSDEDFERDKTPMTKEEIRVLILHKMKLHPDDVVWDVGAGTGSVSIECARQVPFGTVHSIERNETAVKLIYKNKEKFSADNLFVYEGDAAETVAKLPEPDKVFIGGSGKEMSQILEIIAAFPKKIKVVISAVTIETIAETNELLGKYDSDFDVIQATVGRGRKIGSYHIMDTNNPVMIFTAHI